jgi:hypothetical protein
MKSSMFRGRVSCAGQEHVLLYNLPQQPSGVPELATSKLD